MVVFYLRPLTRASYTRSMDANVIGCLKRYVARELYQAFGRPRQQQVDSDAAETNRLKTGS